MINTYVIREAVPDDAEEMIRFLNSVIKTKQKYVSVSRPRRFGKTMAAAPEVSGQARTLQREHSSGWCKL